MQVTPWSVSPQPFPLVSSSRWLKKRGELALFSEELSIWRAFSHRSYYLFLFNDVLIITKRKRSAPGCVTSSSAASTRSIRIASEGDGGQLIQTGAVGEELRGMCEWPC